MRSKLLATRHEPFVLAAKLSGCSDARIIRRHLLPSFLSYLIVDTSIAFPEILLAETSLSFLGLGLREPVESWGVLLFSAQSIRSIDQAPWLMIPGIFVIVAVLAFNFLGDGLRDAADPYCEVVMEHGDRIQCSSVEDLSIALDQDRRPDRHRRGCVFSHRQRRGAGAGRRERLGEKRHGAVADAACSAPACRSTAARIMLAARDGCQRTDIARLGASRQGDRSDPRRPHGHDLPGADELVLAGPHHRRADHRSGGGARGRRPEGSARDRAADLLAKVGIPDPFGALTAIRRSSPAACGSAP